MYKCTTAITSPEAWNAAHWAETSVGAELAVAYAELAGKATTAALAAHTGNKSNPHGVTPAQTGAIPTTASCNKNWIWAGQPGQPNWLWGGNDDPSNMYVYNPANFNVNYANGAYSAHVTANADPGTVSLKNISAGTADIGAGAALATGQIYAVYE